MNAHDVAGRNRRSSASAADPRGLRRAGGFQLYVLAWSLAAGIALHGAAGTLRAQAVWPDAQGERPTVRFEIMRPNFDSDALETLSSAALLAARIPVGERLTLLAEAPFVTARLRTDGDLGGGRETILGNVLLGLEVRRKSAPVYAQVGARIPLAPDDKPVASLVGIFSDLDRWEGYGTDIVPVNAFVGFRKRSENGLLVHVGGGPVMWIPTSGSGDADLLTRTAAQLGYDAGMIGVAGGVTGRALVTESGLDFGERTWFQASVDAWLDLGRLRPGVQFRLPLDDGLTSVVDYAIGVTTEVRL